MTIFAYGHTGAGKSFTVFGDQKNPGILKHLSEHILAKLKGEWVVGMQFVEIYNEQVRDLLVNGGGDAKVEIREDPKKGMVLKDAKSVFIDEKGSLEGCFNIDDVIS